MGIYQSEMLEENDFAKKQILKIHRHRDSNLRPSYYLHTTWPTMPLRNLMIITLQLDYFTLAFSKCSLKAIHEQWWTSFPITLCIVSAFVVTKTWVINPSLPWNAKSWPSFMPHGTFYSFLAPNFLGQGQKWQLTSQIIVQDSICVLRMNFSICIFSK